MRPPYATKASEFGEDGGRLSKGFHTSSKLQRFHGRKVEQRPSIRVRELSDAGVRLDGADRTRK
jgi:hypothetical protein